MSCPRRQQLLLPILTRAGVQGLQGFRASCFSIPSTAQPGQESCLGTAVMYSAEMSVCGPDPQLAGARVDSRADQGPL